MRHTCCQPHMAARCRPATTRAPSPARVCMCPPACRWALALQVVVLGATVGAWATSYVHSYKASLWALASVVTFISIMCCNVIYSAWQFSTVSASGGPWSDGACAVQGVQRGSDGCPAASPWLARVSRHAPGWLV